MIPQASQIYPTREPTMIHKTVRQLDSSASKSRLKPASNRRHWLEAAEYISLVASGLGSLAVALSGQAFYGVAPLTLALSLNLANRYRTEQQVQLSQSLELTQVRQSMEKMEKTAVSVIVKLRQQLSADIEVLRQQLAVIQGPEGFDTIEIEEQLLSLGQSVASLQEIVASALIEVRQQVSEQLQALSIPEPIDLDPIQQAIAQLQSVTKRLGESSLTQDDWEVMNTRFLGIQEAIATLQQELQVASNQQTPDLEHLHARLNQLEQDNRDLVKPSLKRLYSAVKQMQQS